MALSALSSAFVAQKAIEPPNPSIICRLFEASVAMTMGVSVTSLSVVVFAVVFVVVFAVVFVVAFVVLFVAI